MALINNTTSNGALIGARVAAFITLPISHIFGGVDKCIHVVTLGLVPLQYNIDDLKDEDTSEYGALDGACKNAADGRNAGGLLRGLFDYVVQGIGGFFGGFFGLFLSSVIESEKAYTNLYTLNTPAERQDHIDSFFLQSNNVAPDSSSPGGEGISWTNTIFNGARF